MYCLYLLEIAVTVTEMLSDGNCSGIKYFWMEIKFTYLVKNCKWRKTLQLLRYNKLPYSFVCIMGDCNFNSRRQRNLLSWMHLTLKFFGVLFWVWRVFFVCFLFLFVLFLFFWPSFFIYLFCFFSGSNDRTQGLAYANHAYTELQS